MKSETKLVFGVGNPGPEYAGTRHNVGVDFVAFGKSSDPFLWVSSDTFVNVVGPSVKKLKAKHKLKNDDIIVVHDDVDIDFGKYKIAFDRSSAGHRGVQSVMDALKTQKFWRLRIGIANAKLKSARMAKTVPDFVLSKFTSAEREQLPDIFKQALHDLINRFAHA